MVSKKKMIAKTRKFDGKTYGSKREIFNRKSDANRSAERWRRRGWSIRVVPARGGWTLYRRKKR